MARDAWTKRLRSLQSMKSVAKRNGQRKRVRELEGQIAEHKRAKPGAKAEWKRRIGRELERAPKFVQPKDPHIRALFRRTHAQRRAVAKGRAMPVREYAEEHGFDLSALPDDVAAITFVERRSRIKAVFGRCKVWGLRTGNVTQILIQINENVRAHERHRATFLHEVAHAWASIATPRASSHGREWKSHARKLGLRDPQRCGAEVELLERKARKVYAECERCGEEITWTRRPKHHPTAYTHNGCGGRLRAASEWEREAGAAAFPLPVKTISIDITKTGERDD